MSNAGTVRLQKRQRLPSETLPPEDIAWEDTAAGLWAMSFDDVLLARLEARDGKRYA